MKYQEALKYLESFQRFGIRLGLRNIRRLLKLLGNPEKKLKVLHIGGTNGKGSVGAFLFYILKEAGYKVGLYTSPHLIDFRERIRTTQGLISRKELASQVSLLKPLITDHRLPITFFEVTTALALKYFAEQGVDFAILEVGMGGRLDATNVTKPLVSVITNVDFEHTEHLGKSLKKIAYEKCGIIKESVPVITAENKEEALRVIEETCWKKKARLYRVGKEIIVTGLRLQALGFKFQASGSRLQASGLKQHAACGLQLVASSRFPITQTFSIKGLHGSYKNLRISLLGKHQLLNAACALGAVELLQKRFKISKDQIIKGLAQTIWPGRIEVLRLKRSKQKLSPQNNAGQASYPRKVPSEQRGRQAIETGKPANRQTGKLITIILDGMHNVAGARALKEAIKDCFTYKKLILILGILKDKDIKGILAQLVPLASRMIITKPQTPRAAEPEEIAKIVKEYSGSIAIKKKVSQAISQAFSCAESKDIILITGSLYTVGEAIKALVDW